MYNLSVSLSICPPSLWEISFLYLAGISHPACAQFFAPSLCASVSTPSNQRSEDTDKISSPSHLQADRSPSASPILQLLTTSIPPLDSIQHLRTFLALGSLKLDPALQVGYQGWAGRARGNQRVLSLHTYVHRHMHTHPHMLILGE